MAKINKAPRELTDVEIEKGELVYTPDYQTFISGGNKHNNTNSSGNPVVLASGTKILSSKLKADSTDVNSMLGEDKEMSYADMGKKFKTNDFLKDIMNPKSDPISKETSKLMLTKNITNLDAIFELQEGHKAKNSESAYNGIIEKFGLGGKYDNGGYYSDPLLPSGMTEADRRVRKKKYPVQQFTDSPYHQQSLYGKELYKNPTVEQYELLSNGINPDGTYKTDPLSIANRFDSISHLYDNVGSPNWNYIDTYGIKDGKEVPIIQGGKKLLDKFNPSDYTDIRWKNKVNALGHNLPSIADGDNGGWTKDPVTGEKKYVTYQVPKYTNEARDIYDTIDQLKPNLKPLPIKPALPSLERLKELPKPGTSVGTPKENTDDPIKRAYMLSMGKDLLDLSSLSMSPPTYNYKPQNIAYQRFLPQNTMAAERQFNLQKESIENSGAPEQVKQAQLADLYGKLQDNISQVNLQNVQGDLSTDNQNVSLYNNVTNQNRQEKIQYDDRYDELMGRTKSNYNQEKTRLTDQLLNTYGKNAENTSNIRLLNQLGENYTIVNGQIVYKPGVTAKDNTNQMQQFNANDPGMKELEAAMQSTDPRERAEARKLYFQLKYGIK